MATKASIYQEENHIGNSELLDQLEQAMAELVEKMKADVPITRNTVSGATRVGWGVNKIQRGIAADKVISITKVIKSLKGW